MVKEEAILPKYVFRGTSYGYPGSVSSISIPYTCTTKNPAKAILFAMHCKSHFFDNPVIYIAQTVKFEPYELLPQGPLSQMEEEIAWRIKPVDFYKYCDGYLTLDGMKGVLSRAGIPVSGSVNLHNLSLRCEETKTLTVKVIAKNNCLSRRLNQKIGKFTLYAIRE